jgi:acetyltransferase-like isoleucine patch superfamily enzyme
MIEKFKSYIRTKFEFKRFQRQWKQANNHNSLNPVHIFPLQIVTAGKDSYGDLKIMYWNPKVEKLTIGNYVSIASNVTFLLGGNHHIDTLMTYPSCRLGAGGQGSYSKGEIRIEDDVWIGYGSIVLSGVTIGKGAVIGAGSVVGKNIPPYAVAVGNPIQIIKYRFSPEIIERLMQIDYTQLDKDVIKEKIHLLNKPIRGQEDMSFIDEIFTPSN